MPLDSYSPCPGGRDKKIRFCCPDMLKDIQQLETSIENGQYAAALAMVEKLEKDHPNCACLTAAKCLILRETGRLEEFVPLTEAFIKAEPENIRAISEYVIGQAAIGNAKGALSFLIDGIEKTDPGKIDGLLLLPLFMTATQLLDQGNVFAAVALAKLAQAFSPESRETAALLSQIYRRKDIPLVEKELTFDYAAPEDFPFRDKYADAVLRLQTGHWKEGKAILEELQNCAGQWPNLIRSLGLVKFWLCDSEGGAAAMRAFAASEKVLFDDAVDADTTALLTLAGDQSDDVPVLQVVQTITDPESALEKLLSSPRAANMPFDPHQFGNTGQPAPTHAFRIIDKNPLLAGQKPTFENAPTLQGTFLFFGKQTNREARLEIQVFEPLKESLLAYLAETLGSALGGTESETVLAKFPWIHRKLDPEFQLSNSTDLTSSDFTALYRDYLENHFAAEWLAHPVDALGGKSPEAFAKESGDTRILAALIQTVGFQADPRFAEGLMKILREKLSVPEPETIAIPDGADDNDALLCFRAIPVWRWGRVDLSNVSAKVAGQLLQVVTIFADDEAMVRLSDRILSLPADKENANARFLAYQVQVEKSALTQDAAKTLELIRKGMDAAKEAGVSDAMLNLREAMIQLTIGRPDEFRRVVSHVAAEHRNEPQAIAELQMMLMNLGLVNPDGTPRAINPTAAAAAQQGFAAQQQAAPQNESKLWTPDSDTPSGSGGSKLWTPD